MIGVLLAAVVACAPASAPLAVSLLPLSADGVKESVAAGVTARVRAAIAGSEDARVLSSGSADLRDASRCALEPRCLAAAAESRGADVMLAGVVFRHPEGLGVRLLAVDAGGANARAADAVLDGAHDEARLDRAWREVAAPRRLLKGALHLEGEDGIAIAVDGVERGTLPLADIGSLSEGEHEVRGTRAGHVELRRRVRIVHGETTALKLILLAQPTGVAADESKSSRSLIAPITLTALGGAALAGGGVAGVFTLLTSMDVERRARAERLTLPEDADLLAQGTTLSWVANGLYAGGATAIGVGLALWLWPAPTPEGT